MFTFHSFFFSTLHIMKLNFFADIILLFAVLVFKGITGFSRADQFMSLTWSKAQNNYMEGSGSATIK